MSQEVVDHLESRLKESLKEAQRHYDKFVDMREQYNSFVEGRINQLTEQCLARDARDPINSARQTKAKSDITQQLRVNLEAQEQVLKQERKA